jgi:carboxyl-terminal processing protease
MRFLLALLVACSASPKPIDPPPPPLRPEPVTEAPAVRPNREALAYLDGTIVTLAHKYVDPNRFDFRKMLRGALDGMEQEIPEVIAESADDKVTVRVNDEQKTFAGDVDSLAELGIRLTEIVWFVQQHRSPHTESLDVELHAVNGMLHTLDPHTFVISAKEMEDWNVNLSGKFGGLGIVIHMPGERVAVQKVYANTPAAKGGIQVGDKILSINGQSTEALTLDEAMGRLRGDPGSPVRLALERAGKPLDLPLVRAEIKIPVVESHMLDGKVGYVMLDRFDAETAKELEFAMEELRADGAKAWVVDLRENAGGYLTQAVKSADLFVEYGTIVATVAGGKKHDIKNATSGGVDTRRPVVVLIGENTASAAEILAGALKQLDRAVLVGRRTFGKGSVQVLEDAAHDAKFKITTAEYVATNDISPQGGGIQPDLELVPARIPKQINERTPVQLVPEPPFRELDLGAHLETTQKQDTTKPIATIVYHRPDTEEPDVTKDYEVLLARDVALAVNARTRHEGLKQLPKFVAKALPLAERGIADAFKPLGIDWTRGKLGGAKLALKFEPSIKAKTGDVVTLHAEITNTGTVTAFRVHAHAKSDDPSLDGLEMAFGKLAPRETKQATALVKLPRGSAQRVSTITWTLDSGETATTALAIAGTPFPDFALAAELVDNDNVVRAGETIKVRARVTNRGPGRSLKTVVTLKSLTGERIIVDRGRVDVGLLEPGQHKDVELVFATAAKLDLGKLAVELGAADTQLDTGQQLRIELAVGAAPPKPSMTPPRIRVDDVALETAAETIRVAGVAEDDQVVGDVYISVSNRGAKVEERKVFYAAGKAAKLPFSSEVPLAKGVNRIIVTAREHDKSQTVRTLWVTRR